MEFSVGLRFCNVARCFQWFSVHRSPRYKDSYKMPINQQIMELFYLYFKIYSSSSWISKKKLNVEKSIISRF